MAVGVVLDAASYSSMQNHNVLDTHDGISLSNGQRGDISKTLVPSDPNPLQNGHDAPSKLPVSVLETGTSENKVDRNGCNEARQTAAPDNELFHSKRGEWCATMVCYIWFAEASRLPVQQSNASGTKRKRSDTQTWPSRKGLHRPAFSMNSSASPLDEVASRPSRHQVFPTERFVSFVENILRTTQVSQSVVVVLLYYIYRLKKRRAGLIGQHGSEYRLFLTSLILSNKFLDDYTYTNKTWADLSKTPLKEVTKMESQMYAGMGANANVTPSDYAWWCSALKSLKQQREIDMQWLHCKESASSLATSPLSWPLNASPSPTSVEPALALPGHQYPMPSITLSMEPQSGKRKLSWPFMNEREREQGCIRSSPISNAHGYVDNGCSFGPLQVPTSMSRGDWTSKSHSLWPGGCNLEQTLPDPVPSTSIQRHPYSEDDGMMPTKANLDHSISAYIDTMEPANNLPYRESTVNALQSKPMLDMDLFGPYSHFSPPFVNHSSTSTSPIVLAYYRLAAGYPYGIPTSTNVGTVHNRPFFAPHPIFESSNLDVNMSISPSGSVATTRGAKVPLFQEPLTHVPKLWPVQDAAGGNGNLGVRNESGNPVTSIPLQGYISPDYTGVDISTPLHHNLCEVHDGKCDDHGS